jgi:serine/threonine protein kinase
MELPKAFRIAMADHYEIEARLADGSAASVFLANDIRHGRRVALKVLRPDASAAFSDVRFVREIKFLAHLQHPHILALYDSGLAAGLLYYVMPYVPGESLRARLAREKHLPVRDAARIACQLAGALDYAHRHGVIHRDIKPENVLLAETHVMLMDFGIARAIGLAAGEQLTSPLAVGPGTPAYMSPEQFIPGADLDGRTDIYSLGVVVYETLSGELPFDPAGGRMALMRKLGQPAPSLTTVAPAIAPAIAGVVARALATEPNDRYSSAAEFAAALDAAARDAEHPAEHSAEHPAEHLAANAPTPAAPERGRAPAGTPPARRLSRAYRVGILLLCMALLALGVGLVVSH